jgi:hypothetical protein
MILQRDHPPFWETDSSGITVNDTLKAASECERLEALTKAVAQIKTISYTQVVIDRIDILGKEGAQFLRDFYSHMEQVSGPKLKVLITSRPNINIEQLVAGMAYIKYDKERQGLGTTLLSFSC